MAGLSLDIFEHFRKVVSKLIGEKILSLPREIASQSFNSDSSSNNKSAVTIAPLSEECEINLLEWWDDFPRNDASYIVLLQMWIELPSKLIAPVLIHLLTWEESKSNDEQAEEIFGLDLSIDMNMKRQNLGLLRSLRCAICGDFVFHLIKYRLKVNRVYPRNPSKSISDICSSSSSIEFDLNEHDFLELQKRVLALSRNVLKTEKGRNEKEELSLIYSWVRSRAALQWASVIGCLSYKRPSFLRCFIDFYFDQNLKSSSNYANILKSMPLEQLDAFAQMSIYIRLPLVSLPTVCFEMLTLHAAVLRDVIRRQQTAKSKSDYGKSMRLLQLLVLNNLIEQIDFHKLVDLDTSASLGRGYSKENPYNTKDWRKLFEDVIHSQVYKDAETLAKKSDKKKLKAVSLQLMGTILQRSPEDFYCTHFFKFFQNRVIRHISEPRKVKHSLQNVLDTLRGPFTTEKHHWDPFLKYQQFTIGNYLWTGSDIPLRAFMRKSKSDKSKRNEALSLEVIFTEIFEKAKSKALLGTSWTFSPTIRMLLHAYDSRNMDPRIDLYDNAEESNTFLTLSETNELYEHKNICCLILLQMACYDLDFINKRVMPFLLSVDTKDGDLFKAPQLVLNKIVTGLQLAWEILNPAYETFAFLHEENKMGWKPKEQRDRFIMLCTALRKYLSLKLSKLLDLCNQAVGVEILGQAEYTLSPTRVSVYSQSKVETKQKHANVDLPFDNTGSKIGSSFNWYHSFHPRKEKGISLTCLDDQDPIWRVLGFQQAALQQTSHLLKRDFVTVENKNKKETSEVLRQIDVSSKAILNRTKKQNKAERTQCLLILYQEVILSLPLCLPRDKDSWDIGLKSLPDMRLLLHTDFGVATCASHSLQIVMLHAGSDMYRVLVIQNLCQVIKDCICKEAVKSASEPKRILIRNCMTFLKQLLLMLQIWLSERSKMQYEDLKIKELSELNPNSASEWFEMANCKWVTTVQATVLALFCIPCPNTHLLLTEVAEKLKKLVLTFAIYNDKGHSKSPFLIDWLYDKEIMKTCSGTMEKKKEKKSHTKTRGNQNFRRKRRSSSAQLNLHFDDTAIDQTKTLPPHRSAATEEIRRSLTRTLSSRSPLATSTPSSLKIKQAESKINTDRLSRSNSFSYSTTESKKQSFSDLSKTKVDEVLKKGEVDKPGDESFFCNEQEISLMESSIENHQRWVSKLSKFLHELVDSRFHEELLNQTFNMCLTWNHCFPSLPKMDLSAFPKVNSFSHNIFQRIEKEKPDKDILFNAQRYMGILLDIFFRANVSSVLISTGSFVKHKILSRSKIESKEGKEVPVMVVEAGIDTSDMVHESVTSHLFDLWDCAVETKRSSHYIETNNSLSSGLVNPYSKKACDQVVDSTIGNMCENSIGVACHPANGADIVSLILQWKGERLKSLRKFAIDNSVSGVDSSAGHKSVLGIFSRKNKLNFPTMEDIQLAVVTVQVISLRLIRIFANDCLPGCLSLSLDMKSREESEKVKKKSCKSGLDGLSEILQDPSIKNIIQYFRVVLEEIKAETLQELGFDYCSEVGTLVFSFSNALHHFTNAVISLVHNDGDDDYLLFRPRNVHMVSDIVWPRAERRHVWQFLRRLSGYSDLPVVLDAQVNRKQSDRMASSYVFIRAATELLILGPVCLGKVAPKPEKSLWNWLFSQLNMPDQYNDTLESETCRWWYNQNSPSLPVQRESGPKRKTSPTFISAYLVSHWRVGDLQAAGGGTFVPFLNMFYDELESLISFDDDKSFEEKCGKQRTIKRFRSNTLFDCLCAAVDADLYRNHYSHSDAIKVEELKSEVEYIEPSAEASVLFLALLMARSNQDPSRRRNAVIMLKSVMGRWGVEMSQFELLCNTRSICLSAENAISLSTYVCAQMPHSRAHVFNEFNLRLPRLYRSKELMKCAVDIILPWCVDVKLQLNSSFLPRSPSSSPKYSSGRKQSYNTINGMTSEVKSSAHVHNRSKSEMCALDSKFVEIEQMICLRSLWKACLLLCTSEQKNKEGEIKQVSKNYTHSILPVIIPVWLQLAQNSALTIQQTLSFLLDMLTIDITQSTAKLANRFNGSFEYIGMESLVCDLAAVTLIHITPSLFRCFPKIVVDILADGIDLSASEEDFWCQRKNADDKKERVRRWIDFALHAKSEDIYVNPSDSTYKVQNTLLCCLARCFATDPCACIRAVPLLATFSLCSPHGKMHREIEAIDEREGFNSYSKDFIDIACGIYTASTDISCYSVCNDYVLMFHELFRIMEGPDLNARWCSTLLRWILSSSCIAHILVLLKSYKKLRKAHGSFLEWNLNTDCFDETSVFNGDQGDNEYMQTNKNLSKTNESFQRSLSLGIRLESFALVTVMQRILNMDTNSVRNKEPGENEENEQGLLETLECLLNLLEMYGSDRNELEGIEHSSVFLCTLKVIFVLVRIQNAKSFRCFGVRSPVDSFICNILRNMLVYFPKSTTQAICISSDYVMKYVRRLVIADLVYDLQHFDLVGEELKSRKTENCSALLLGKLFDVLLEADNRSMGMEYFVVILPILLAARLIEWDKKTALAEFAYLFSFVNNSFKRIMVSVPDVFMDWLETGEMRSQWLPLFELFDKDGPGLDTINTIAEILSLYFRVIEAIPKGQNDYCKGALYASCFRISRACMECLCIEDNETKLQRTEPGQVRFKFSLVFQQAINLRLSGNYARNRVWKCALDEASGFVSAYSENPLPILEAEVKDKPGNVEITESKGKDDNIERCKLSDIMSTTLTEEREELILLLATDTDDRYDPNGYFDVDAKHEDSSSKEALVADTNQNNIIVNKKIPTSETAHLLNGEESHEDSSSKEALVADTNQNNIIVNKKIPTPETAHLLNGEESRARKLSRYSSSASSYPYIEEVKEVLRDQGNKTKSTGLSFDHQSKKKKKRGKLRPVPLPPVEDERQRVASLEKSSTETKPNDSIKKVHTVLSFNESRGELTSRCSCISKAVCICDSESDPELFETSFGLAKFDSILDFCNENEDANCGTPSNESATLAMLNDSEAVCFLKTFINDLPVERYFFDFAVAAVEYKNNFCDETRKSTAGKIVSRFIDCTSVDALPLDPVIRRNVIQALTNDTIDSHLFDGALVVAVRYIHNNIYSKFLRSEFFAS